MNILKLKRALNSCTVSIYQTPQVSLGTPAFFCGKRVVNGGGGRIKFHVKKKGHFTFHIFNCANYST